MLLGNSASPRYFVLLDSSCSRLPTTCSTRETYAIAALSSLRHDAKSSVAHLEHDPSRRGCSDTASCCARQSFGFFTHMGGVISTPLRRGGSSLRNVSLPAQHTSRCAPLVAVGGAASSQTPGRPSHVVGWRQAPRRCTEALKFPFVLA